MADVYLADDTEAGRCVVLKVIERSSKESVRLAIEAESRGARIQQQLRERDKRILEVYEEGEHDGRFFVALEYVPGRTLAEILEQSTKSKPNGRRATQRKFVISCARCTNSSPLEAAGKRRWFTAT